MAINVAVEIFAFGKNDYSPGGADPGPYQNHKSRPGHHPESFRGYNTHARSARRVLEKFVQRIYSFDDWPGRNRNDYGIKQRFNGKFPTLFAREITSG